MSSLCKNGGVVQLRRKKVSSSSSSVAMNPSNMGSMQHDHRQEMLPEYSADVYSDDQYSDIIGYPTLPRPKTILSLSRASFPWSIHQASKLRAKKGRRSEFERQLHSVCVDAAVSPVQVKANTELNFTKRVSLSGNSEELNNYFQEGSSCFMLQARQSQSNSVSGDEMSNHSKVKSKRGQATTGACEPAQQKAKKSRKPSKALTFSFGSGSDLKRRTLGFLGKGEKKTSDRSSSSSVTPKSPILVSRKTKTLPSGGRASKEVIHLNSNDSTPTVYGSYQDVHAVRSPGMPRPSPLRDSPGQQYHGTGEESPQAESSPASTSSMQSSESLPFGGAKIETSPPQTGTVCSPSSRRQSPAPFKSRQHGAFIHQANTTSVTSTSKRKLSDPMFSTPSAGSSPRTSPGPHRSTLKKRNTFCVRPSRLNVDTEQEWVSERAGLAEWKKGQPVTGHQNTSDLG